MFKNIFKKKKTSSAPSYRPNRDGSPGVVINRVCKVEVITAENSFEARNAPCVFSQ